MGVRCCEWDNSRARFCARRLLNAPVELANPVSSFQVYGGDDRRSVTHVCKRLVAKARLPSPRADLWGAALGTYEGPSLPTSPGAQRPEDMALWRDGVIALISCYDVTPSRRTAAAAGWQRPRRVVLNA